MSIDTADIYSSDWNTAYKVFKERAQDLAYPSETLVRLFKGNYLTGNYVKMQGCSVLDVGFGCANNAAFFASIGMSVSGIEIHSEICEAAKSLFEELSFTGDFRVGTNRAIPFPDNTFDYLVSWNVIHYEGSENNIKSAIKEYGRVLKPGGMLVLSTTGPKHKLLDGAEALDSHIKIINRKGDFRVGQQHFVFQTYDDIQNYFSASFKNLQVGRIEDFLFRDKLDWWLLSAIK